MLAARAPRPHGPAARAAVAVALLYAAVEDASLSVAVKVSFAAQSAQRFVLVSRTYVRSDFNMHSLSMMSKLVSICLLLFSAERGLQQVRAAARGPRGRHTARAQCAAGVQGGGAPLQSRIDTD